MVERYSDCEYGSLTMRVTVYDEHAQELNRARHLGTGYGEIDGACDAGREALETATKSGDQDRDAELRQPDHQRRRDIESNEKNG